MKFIKHACVTEPTPCIGDGLNTMTNFSILDFERIEWEDCTGADCFSKKGFSYSKIALFEGVTIDFITSIATLEEVKKAFYRSNDEMKITALEYRYGDDSRFFYQGNDQLPLSDHSPLALVFKYEFHRK